MTFIVYALSIADQQDLGGFVLYPEGVDYFIGNGPVADEVEVIEIDGSRLAGPFQAIFDQRAGRAPGAMFEDKLGAVGRFFPDPFQLVLCL